MYFFGQGRKKFHQEKFKTSIQTMAVGLLEFHPKLCDQLCATAKYRNVSANFKRTHRKTTFKMSCTTEIQMENIGIFFSDKIFQNI